MCFALAIGILVQGFSIAAKEPTIVNLSTEIGRWLSVKMFCQKHNNTGG